MNQLHVGLENSAIGVRAPEIGFIKELLALAEARVEQVHLAVVLTATAAIKA